MDPGARRIARAVHDAITQDGAIQGSIMWGKPHYKVARCGKGGWDTICGGWQASEKSDSSMSAGLCLPAGQTFKHRPTLLVKGKPYSGFDSYSMDIPFSVSDSVLSDYATSFQKWAAETAAAYRTKLGARA
jgi:hypothetical protein